jgi:hypothetical protein
MPSFPPPPPPPPFLPSFSPPFVFLARIQACLFNSLWIIVFSQDNDAATWFSTILIASLLFSICKIYLNTNCWRATRPGGFVQTVAVDLHFAMYAAWVTVATIVDFSLALTTISSPSSDTASAWCVVILVVALVLVTFIIVTRRDATWGFVLAWACYWIAEGNKGDPEADGGPTKDDRVAIAGSLVVCILITIISFGLITHIAFAMVGANDWSWSKGKSGPTGATPAKIATPALQGSNDLYVEMNAADDTLHPL